MPSTESNAGLNLSTMGQWPELETKICTFKWLSHPGTPWLFKGKSYSLVLILASFTLLSKVSTYPLLVFNTCSRLIGRDFDSHHVAQGRRGCHLVRYPGWSLLRQSDLISPRGTWENWGFQMSTVLPTTNCLVRGRESSLLPGALLFSLLIQVLYISKDKHTALTHRPTWFTSLAFSFSFFDLFCTDHVVANHVLPLTPFVLLSWCYIITKCLILIHPLRIGIMSFCLFYSILHRVWHTINI